MKNEVKNDGVKSGNINWYFGHYHDYRQVNFGFVLLYENIIPLEFDSIF